MLWLKVSLRAICLYVRQQRLKKQHSKRPESRVKVGWDRKKELTVCWDSNLSMKNVWLQSVAVVTIKIKQLRGTVWPANLRTAWTLLIWWALLLFLWHKMYIYKWLERHLFLYLHRTRQTQSSAVTQFEFDQGWPNSDAMGSYISKNHTKLGAACRVETARHLIYSYQTG